jgi:phage I-like protein
MVPVGDASGDVANEFCLLKAGANSYADGDTILFDSEAATETLKRYQARGIDLMADYEHMSLARPPQPAPASAKKWVPEVRNGDLMATQIAWTDKAKSMLSAGEYRYFSIACRVDAKTNRCVELINFALTNLPAGNGLTALVAASRNFTDEDNEMSKTLIVALGMNADADETAAFSRATRLAELERDVLALTKTKTLHEANGVLHAHAAAHGRVLALSAELEQVKRKSLDAEFDALVKQGQDEKKLTKAQAGGEWIAQMRARETGCAEIRAYLKEACVLVAKANEFTESEKPVEASADVSAMDKKIAERLIGPDPVALKKHLDELRAYRVSLKEGI